jgi:VCBS repeat-containing protein
MVSGAVTEDVSSQTSPTRHHTRSTTVDLIDVHSTSVVAAGPIPFRAAFLTASVTDYGTGAGDGTVTGTTALQTAATQYLGLGQTATEQFTVTISDGNGGTVSTSWSRSLSPRTNDTPTIVCRADSSGCGDRRRFLTEPHRLRHDHVRRRRTSPMNSTAFVAAGSNTSADAILTASVTDTPLAPVTAP